MLVAYALDYNDSQLTCRITLTAVTLEDRTARFTILIDPRKKALFERLCAQEDLTPSQVVRRMIRSYIEQRLGRPWTPGEEDPIVGGGADSRSAPKRRAPRP